MHKVISLREAKRKIKPNTVTLVGGAFNLFHVGHLRYLRAASRRGRPLVVIVQTDRMVSVRKGLSRPIITQVQRAEIIAALEFVDYVLILDKPSHYDGYLKILQPRRLIFFKENMAYRRRRADDIRRDFPKVKVIFIGPKEVGNKIMSTTRIAQKILKKPSLAKIKNPLARELHELAERSKARVGKISAFLMRDGEVVCKAQNTASELHAEILLIRAIKKKRIRLDNEFDLYVLIPPCISCSENIVKAGIRSVHYLYPYGNDDGLVFLRKNGVGVRKIH